MWMEPLHGENDCNVQTPVSLKSGVHCKICNKENCSGCHVCSPFRRRSKTECCKYIKRSCNACETATLRACVKTACKRRRFRSLCYRDNDFFDNYAPLAQPALTIAATSCLNSDIKKIPVSNDLEKQCVNKKTYIAATVSNSFLPAYRNTHVTDSSIQTNQFAIQKKRSFHCSSTELIKMPSVSDKHTDMECVDVLNGFVNREKETSLLDTEEDTPFVCKSCSSSSISKPLANGTYESGSSLVITKGIVGSLDNGFRHRGLRPSLFPFVPPYIDFKSDNENGDTFPGNIRHQLRWKMSSVTPLVVRSVVINSGFRLMKKCTEWSGIWGKHEKSCYFKTVRDYQKVNHFPGSFHLGRKDRLWKNLYRLKIKCSSDKFDFMPDTYILPGDMKYLRLAWGQDGENCWIVKPPASARGSGIKVIHSWNQIPRNKGSLVVQKYVSNPYLINNTKFDLRLYVLVTSFNPLCVYLYDNGLVRFASVKYSKELSTLGDRYMHLTNYSINKLSHDYTHNDDAAACQGHKWTLKTLWKYMKRELNADVEKIQELLTDLVIKTIISGESNIIRFTKANMNSRYNCYELFGIDVLFDENLKPWLLEVNISPSLHSSSSLDVAVKVPLIRDTLNITGYHIPASKKFSEARLKEDLNTGHSPLCYDKRMYIINISLSEKEKQQFFLQSSREEYLDTILDDLTPDDVRHLIRYEDELTQLGSFQKIFPTTKTHRYFEYFSTSRYYNMLFDAWENRYYNCRQEGIDLLITKCYEQMHLDVSLVSGNTFKTFKTLQRRRHGQKRNAVYRRIRYRVRRKRAW